MSHTELASPDEDEALLLAFDRLERIVQSQFRDSVGTAKSPADLSRLLGLLDDLNVLTAQMRGARDRIKTRLDGANSGLHATGAYGVASRLGRKT